MVHRSLSRRSALSRFDSAGETLIRLLSRKIVKIPITHQSVRRFIRGRAKLLTHLLPWAKCVRHKNRVFTDSFPQQSRSVNRSSRTLNNDDLSVPDPGAPSGPRVDLYQANAIHQLAGVRPLRYTRE